MASRGFRLPSLAELLGAQPSDGFVHVAYVWLAWNEGMDHCSCPYMWRLLKLRGTILVVSHLNYNGIFESILRRKPHRDSGFPCISY